MSDINVKMKDKKTYGFLQYLFVILLILESNSIYSQIYGIHLIIRSFLIMFSIGIILFFLIVTKPKLYKNIFGFVIYIFISGLLMFINTDSLNGKIIIILVFLLYLPLTLIYISNLKIKGLIDLLKKFVNVVIVLCIISMIFWVMSSIFNILRPTSTIKTVWGKPYSIFDTFFYLHFNTQDVWWITGSPLIRNTGIFVEGPMYAYILIIALIFNNLLCFEETKSNLRKNAILFITMISTFSVTGVICAILLIIPNYIYHLKKKKKNKKLYTIMIVIVLVMILITIPFWINLLNKKLQTGSAIHRQMDIKNGLEIFVKKPVLGNGILYDKISEDDYENGYGYSNTIIPVLTDGGIMLGLIYLLPVILLMYKNFKWDRKNINKYILLSLIYMIILFTTLVQYRLTLMFLIAIIYYLQFNIRRFKEKI